MNDKVSTNESAENKPAKRNVGFARLSPEQRKAMSARGGVASHEKGTGHQFTTETGRAASQKRSRAAGGNRHVARADDSV